MSPADADERNLKAYTFGQFARHLAGVKSATKWLQNNGHLKSQTEGTDSAGGYTVPNIVSSDLIWLREMYGVARRNSRIYPMSSDTLLVPSATASTTVYYASEATAITASDITFGQVSLAAKKLAVLTIASKELGEDTVIDLGAALARDMAYAIAKEEDNAAFNGDGTSTYGSITGILQAVYGLNATKANIAGVVVGANLSGAAFSNFTLANFQSCVAKLPTYADNAKWYMHKDLFFNGVADKLIALGGNAILDIQNAYTSAPTLFGYPIEWVQNMPKTPAATQSQVSDAPRTTACENRLAVERCAVKPTSQLPLCAALHSERAYALSQLFVHPADAALLPLQLLRHHHLGFFHHQK